MGTHHALATFVAETQFEDLPAEIVEQSKRLTLDYLCAGLLGARSDLAPRYREVMSFGATGESTVLGQPARATPPIAAALNAAFGHQVEFAEGVSRAVVHSSNAVVPAALAVAESERSTGAEYVRAVALGCEALIRWGYCLNSHPDRLPDGDNPVAYRSGWWTPAALAPLGAATAATLLLGGDRAELLRAWGLATNLCPTATRALVHEGGDGKGIVLGVGCMSGVLAAQLAHVGVSGLEDIEAGWLRLFGGPFDPRRLSDGLGTTYELSYVLFKYFATPGPIFASLEAVFALLRRDGPIDPTAIEAIEIDAYRRTKEFHRSTPPENAEAARADVGFCVARAFVTPDPSAFLEAAFTDEAIADPMTRALTEKLTVRIDAGYDAQYPAKAAIARLTVTLRNGERRTIEADRASIPRYHYPEHADTEEKFGAVAARTMSEEQTAQVISSVWDLERLPAISVLSRALRVEH